MNQTVLIADGDTDLCGVYGRFLRARGYEVATASDALECLAKLRGLRPAVLVLDLDLRWGGGGGVLAWLHEQGPKPRGLAILIAPANYWQNLAEFIKPPVVTFLPKPLVLTALLESIRAALAKKDREEHFNQNCAAAC